ncbi:DUF2510 domain-containing protein [Nocardioides campestrisoli]|uniref:DUF2510 domain-containing protein n=1 Tax=Nocardioides campestrisoli TaxID=2736757 RepID=UPI0015E6EA86|nr:DUF2510 domain-containing protein [Nocardioides campestrisoli]
MKKRGKKNEFVLKPGWYRDPSRPGLLAYWDGEDFDDSVAPRPAPEPLWKRARVIALGILMAVAALYLFQQVTRPSDLDCSIQRVEVLQGDRFSIDSACVGR